MANSGSEATREGNIAVALSELARLWACRLLVNGRGFRALDERKCRIDDDMCRFVGLNPERAGTDRPYARQRLRSSLSRLTRRVSRWPTPLAERLDELGGQLSLDTVERELLGLMALVADSDELREAAQTTAQAGRLDHLDLAACALDRPVADVEPALRPTGRLARTGLLQLNVERGRQQMRISEEIGTPAFELLDGLITALTSRTDSIEHFLARYFERTPVDKNDGLDFDHVGDEIRRIGGLIDHALEQGEAGVNVLVHGPPGVGKTELVRYLAGRYGWDLYAVTSSDAEETSLTGRRRFRAYQLCQFLLERHERGVLLFDEIEDVFDTRFVGLPDRLGPLGEAGCAGKAWTNRLLEDNPRPVIWVCNGTDMLEPAYLRRFDYILRIDTPPRPARRGMLAREFEGLPLPTEWLDERAGDTDMTPARIAQLGRLARRLEKTLPGAELPSVLDAQLGQQRVVLGSAAARGARRHDPLGAFDPAFMNTQPSAEALLRGLEHQGAGTVLMHGPPGTGKTAFAEHVAEQLGCELVTRSASELLDKFVGESEKALARMFDEADRSDAVLLLDEADNFLTARAEARNRWELTQTNELLVRMERFRGIFLCATNLLDILDSAAMRRFDVKLEFGYLTDEQRWCLFERLIELYGLPKLRGAKAQRVRARLDRLDQMTPGDFAAMAKGGELLDNMVGGTDMLIEGLASAQRLKARGHIMWRGFV